MLPSYGGQAAIDGGETATARQRQVDRLAGVPVASSRVRAIPSKPYIISLPLQLPLLSNLSSLASAADPFLAGEIKFSRMIARRYEILAKRLRCENRAGISGRYGAVLRSISRLNAAATAGIGRGIGGKT